MPASWRASICLLIRRMLSKIALTEIERYEEGVGGAGATEADQKLNCSKKLTPHGWIIVRLTARN